MSNSGTALGLEIAVFVHAPDQHRQIAHARGLADIGRNVADGEANAPPGGRVWLRPVDQPHMVERHLAGLQRQFDSLALVHLHHDFLAAAQQIVLARKCRDAAPDPACAIPE